MTAAFLLALGLASSQADEARKPHVLFMIGEREYLTRESLPKFAQDELAPLGFRVTIVHADALP